MNVMIDVDGVCADFVTNFYAIGQEFNPSIPLRTTHTQADWSIWEGFTREDIQKTWLRIKQSPTFWANLNSLMSWPDRASIRFASLVPNIGLYFVTSRPGYNVKQQTEVWFRSLIPGFDPTVLVVERAHHKADIAKALDIGLSLEDNEENAHDIGKVIGRNNSYLLPRQYNRKHKQSPDVSGIMEFLLKAGVDLNVP